MKDNTIPLNDEKLIKNDYYECLFPVRKILVAVDGSDPSFNASTYAIDLSMRFDAELIALYVIDPTYWEMVLEVPEYTYGQFKEIAVTRLEKEKVDRYMGQVIAEKVWSELGSDIPDVINVGRLSESVEEVSLIIKLMKSKSRTKYCKFS